MNPTKDVQNRYTENYKTLLREIKDLHKIPNHVHQLEDSIVKMAVQISGWVGAVGACENGWIPKGAEK